VSAPVHLRDSLTKEFRALAAPWLASLATIGAAAFLGGRWRVLVLPAYFLGAVALGALSMGHEYSHRTITLLLSQPVSRKRILADKLSVLAILLLTVSTASSLFVFQATGLRNPGHASEWAAGLLLPVLCAVCLAPWLTMLCRSAVAGAVFTMAVPGLLLILGEVFGLLMYGHSAAANELRTALLWRGMPGACAVGGVMGWRTFMRLEAIEGRGQDVQLPQWLAPWRTLSAERGARARHPIWLLMKKEVRLQQLPLAVSGLYLIAWAAVVPLRHVAPELAELFGLVTVFYCALLSVLIGSLACAEERQMGTVEWQGLLPMAASTQWAVKVSVAVSLALVLALGLPTLLAGEPQLLPYGLRGMPFDRMLIPMPVIALTIGGIYVSSLCRSGLWALLISLPAMLGVVVFVRALGNPLARVAFALVSYVPVLTVRQWLPADSRIWIVVLWLVIVAGFLAVVLRFALANQRTVDRAPGRIMTQVIGIAAVLAIGLTLMAALGAFFSKAALSPRTSALRPQLSNLSSQLTASFGPRGFTAQNPQLNQQAGEVVVPALVDDEAIPHLEEEDAAEIELPSGRRKTHEVAAVCRVHGELLGDAVAVHQELLAGVTPVGKGREERLV
jgi:ABC-2 family transporter protein